MNKNTKKKVMIGFFAAIAIVVAYIVLSKPTQTATVSVAESTITPKSSTSTSVVAPVVVPMAAPGILTVN